MLKLDPKAVLDCFLTHTLGVEVNINYEEMTNTTYVDRTVTEKGLWNNCNDKTSKHKTIF